MTKAFHFGKYVTRVSLKKKKKKKLEGDITQYDLLHLD